MALFACAAAAISSVRAPAIPPAAKCCSAAAKMRLAVAGFSVFRRPRGMFARTYSTNWLVYLKYRHMSKDAGPEDRAGPGDPSSLEGAGRAGGQLDGIFRARLFTVQIE